MAVVGLNAIDMIFFIPAYPFWALTIIAVDVVALYGLCAYGSSGSSVTQHLFRSGPSALNIQAGHHAMVGRNAATDGDDRWRRR